MNPLRNEPSRWPRARRALGVGAACAGLVLATTGFQDANSKPPTNAPAQDATASNATKPETGDAPAPTLRDARVVLGKWIETQQIYSKEAGDWQQGREVLGGRIELLRREVVGLQDKLVGARQKISETRTKKDELVAVRQQLDATLEQLARAVATMEKELRALQPKLPDPVKTRLQPLFGRMPDGTETEKRVSVPERFQNVLGILNELNKANGELSVNYEVRELAGAKPTEVRVLYVGLAQAYYVSGNGQAGIGRPGENGWTWEPNAAVANDVLTALEIVEGKHTPAFVPLPVRIQ